MSSDNQYTALGPAIVGFQTDGTRIDRGADIAGNVVGIKGTCSGPNGDGVQGFGSGNFSGCAGFGASGANSAGTGLFGMGGVQVGNLFTPMLGAGVRGIGGGGPNTSPHGGVGVYGQGSTQSPGVVGQAGSRPADGVQGFGSGDFSGVAGFGGEDDGTGAFGVGGGANGPGVRGIGAGAPNTVPHGSVGVYGQGGSSGDGVQGVSGGLFNAGVRGTSLDMNGNGVIGEANNGPFSFAVWGRSSSGFAGFFQGNVLVRGNLDVTGTKSALVAFPDGTQRRLFCVEAPESWFEDFGTAHLVAGEAQIELDPNFANVVGGDEYHVFISEYDDNNGLYVTARSNRGFGVRSTSPNASTMFSYRIVAKRRDVSACRFETAPAPDATAASKQTVRNALPIEATAAAPARPIAQGFGSGNC